MAEQLVQQCHSRAAVLLMITGHAGRSDQSMPMRHADADRKLSTEEREFMSPSTWSRTIASTWISKVSTRAPNSSAPRRQDADDACRCGDQKGVMPWG